MRTRAQHIAEEEGMEPRKMRRSSADDAKSAVAPPKRKRISRNEVLTRSSCFLVLRMCAPLFAPAEARLERGSDLLVLTLSLASLADARSPNTCGTSIRSPKRASLIRKVPMPRNRQCASPLCPRFSCPVTFSSTRPRGRKRRSASHHLPNYMTSQLQNLQNQRARMTRAAPNASPR